MADRVVAFDVIATHERRARLDDAGVGLVRLWPLAEHRVPLAGMLLRGDVAGQDDELAVLG